MYLYELAKAEIVRSWSSAMHAPKFQSPNVSHVIESLSPGTPSGLQFAAVPHSDGVSFDPSFVSLYVSAPAPSAVQAAAIATKNLTAREAVKEQSVAFIL
jgi:hypothetical protein